MPLERSRWIDDAFRAFAHPLRRELLCQFHDHGHTITDVAELGEILAASFEDATEQDLRMALRHRHLPKLRAVGFVEYDPRTGDVRYQPNAFVDRVVHSGVFDGLQGETVRAGETGGDQSCANDTYP